MRQRMVVLLTGYAVVAIFGGVYLIVRLNWPDTAVGVAVGAGALAAAPLMVAATWERLAGVKAFGMEVTLGEVVVPIDRSISSVLSSVQYFSGLAHIVVGVQNVIQHPDVRLVEVNLRSRPYWWSTRLFLQAVLFEEYSHVERFIFVENDGERRYVGMASPAQVREMLANQFSYLEKVLEQVYGSIPQPGGNIQSIVDSWAAAKFPDDKRNFTGEQDAKVLVTSTELRMWAAGLCDGRDAVELNGIASSHRLRSRILQRHKRFVALVRDRRLVMVVDADGLALRS
jgi:hypothetical protein